MAAVENIRLSDLGDGASILIWGLRSCVYRNQDTKSLQIGYENVCGKYGLYALQSIKAVVKEISKSGRRSYEVGMPDCCHVTHDELSFISAIAAIQNDQHDRCHAHLCWMLASTHVGTMLKLCTLVGNALTHSNIAITQPRRQTVYRQHLPNEITSLVVSHV